MSPNYAWRSRYITGSCRPEDRLPGPALCSQDFHGDIAVAKASAQAGVPMAASTLTQDRMEEVAPTGRRRF
jgi:hypothetical protein